MQNLPENKFTVYWGPMEWDSPLKENLLYKHLTQFFAILILRHSLNYFQFGTFFITPLNTIIPASTVRIFTGSSPT